MNEFHTRPLAEVVGVTDFVANGSFSSLRENVQTSVEPSFAILARLVDHNAGWTGPFSYVDEESYRFLAKSCLATGDVIIANVGANAGTVFRLPELPRPATLGPNAVLCRPRDESVLSREFLYYYLSSPAGQSSLADILTGSAQPKFNKTALRQLPLPLPAIDAQRSTAEVLGALDDKIAANTELARTADELASSMYSSAVEPASLVPMSQKLTPILGGTPSRSRDDYWGGDERWISAKDVTGAFGHLILDTEEKITTLATESTKAKPLPKGSVIMTARGTVGAVAWLGEPSAFNQSCYGFIPGEVPASILYFAVRRAADHARSMAHGSVFDTITKKTFDHLLMPDLEDSEAYGLDAVLAPLLAMMESSARENLKLADLRDTLLPQLMSGKLRVKDAEAVVEEAVS